MDDLYREIIIDHYKNPIHKGHIEESDYTFEDENPLCGDHIQIELKVDQSKKVIDAKFNGQGCAISISAADLLLDSIIGKSVEESESFLSHNLTVFSTFRH